MVHALEEIRRVLVPDAYFVDLRPLAANWPVEVVSRRIQERAGNVTDSEAGVGDDRAANEAVAAGAEQGWYKREKERFFPFNYYWDSPEQMFEYVQAEWSGFASLEEEVLKRVRSIWAVADADARVRIQLNMLITRWRRLAVLRAAQ